MRSLILIALCIGVASAASIAIQTPKIEATASASASASVSTGGTTRTITDQKTDFDSSTGASASASASASVGGTIDLTKTNIPCINIDQPEKTVTAVQQPCQVVSATADAFVTADGQKISVNDESLGWKKITKEEAQTTPCAPGTFRRKIILNPETGERTCLPAFEIKKTLAPCFPCAPTVVYKPQVQRCYVPQTKCVPTYRRPCPPTYYRRPCPPVRRYASACASSYVRRAPCVVQKTITPAQPCAPRVIKIEQPAAKISTQAVACAQTTGGDTKTAVPCETPEVKIPEIDCDLSAIKDMVTKIGATGTGASAFASASASSSTSTTTTA